VKRKLPVPKKKYVNRDKVRFGALKVLEGLHARLGKDFMVLLSETIPFLAELMEGFEQPEEGHLERNSTYQLLHH